MRSFSPDRLPVVGFAKDEPSFFWLAGQGGYGIQTAAAASATACALLLHEDLPEAVRAQGVDAARLGPERFGRPG